MESVSRRDLVAGSVAAAAIGAVAASSALATEYAEEPTEAGDLFLEAISQFDYGVDKETPGLKHAAGLPPEGTEKKVVIINGSATVGGNGDTIASIIEEQLAGVAQVTRFDLRNCDIAFVKQRGDLPPVIDTSMDHDAMDYIIPALHEATGIISIFPTSYNTIDPRTLNMIWRLWQPTWSNPDYELGYEKRVGVIGTCTGSFPSWLTLNVEAILTLPDVLQSVADKRIEIFPYCVNVDTVATNEEFSATVRDVADWVVAE